MKLTYILPIAIGGGALLYFLSKAQAGKSIAVNFKGIKTKGKDIFATFILQNSSSTQVTVNSIFGDVYVNGQVLANVSNADTFTINGNDEATYTVKLTPNYLSIAQIVFNMLSFKQQFKVQFIGKINSSGAIITVNQTIFQR